MFKVFNVKCHKLYILFSQITAASEREMKLTGTRIFCATKNKLALLNNKYILKSLSFINLT